MTRMTRITRGLIARPRPDQGGAGPNGIVPRGRGAAASLRLLPMLVVLALAAGGGCHRDAHEEPEHHVPAHRPADYPTAVARLEELHRKFLAGELAGTAMEPAGTATEPAATAMEPNGTAREAVAIDPFDEFHDVARWLPELAGDSDLAEAEWVRVERQARTFVDAFAPVRAAALADRPRSYDGRRELFEAGLRELRAVADSFPRSKIQEARE
ncbi:MAG: hypothetical protein RLY70_170 [Planctomycetota bacterium]